MKKIILALCLVLLAICINTTIADAGGPGKVRISSVRFPDRVSVQSGARLQIPVIGDTNNIKSVKVSFNFLLYSTISSITREGHATRVIHTYRAKLHKKRGIITVHVPFRKKGDRGGTCKIVYIDTNTGEMDETDSVPFPIFTVE